MLPSFGRHSDPVGCVVNDSCEVSAAAAQKNSGNKNDVSHNDEIPSDDVFEANVAAIFDTRFQALRMLS